ncbi:MAG: hypothetical protein HQL53_07720 [Magnetococcales bacterium]|nr:hypothetical protein [Magnetococcales bacterium]
MTALLLIDGLTAPEDPPLGAYMSHLADLLAAGHPTGALNWQADLQPEEGGRWRAVFDVPEASVGYLAALGCGLEPDPRRTWARLAFTHIKRKRDKLLFLSPHRTGQSADECRGLANYLRPELERLDWLLHLGPESHLFLSSELDVTAPVPSLARLEGASMADFLPDEKEAKPLHEALMMAQLMVARAPVNRARSREGRLVLNAPWLWGIGPGVGDHSDSVADTGPDESCCWSPEPLLAGLARMNGMIPVLLPEEEPLDAIWSAMEARGDGESGRDGSDRHLVHLISPALLGRHGMREERLTRLERIDAQLIAPWVDALVRRGQRLIIASSYALDRRGLGDPEAPCPWVHLGANPSLWQRMVGGAPSGQLGVGPSWSASALRKQWMK